MTIERCILRPPQAGFPYVVAAFSYRYDAHLVPDFLANISPAIDAWVAWDDRGDTTSLSSEVSRRGQLLNAAVALGATWILAADPDERFADRLATEMPRLTRHGPVRWMFDCREMFTPTTWRTDGLWGQKKMQRLLPVTPDLRVGDQALHGHWFGYDTPPPLRDSGLCFYHLRMATPARRAHRRALYALADADRRFQAVGYDYLDDHRLARFADVSADLPFSPPFVEDDGLWGPPVAAGADVPRDPVRARLAYMARAADLRDPAMAFLAATDLASAVPDSPEFALIAAMMALKAGHTNNAARHAADAVGLQPTSAAAVHLSAQVAVAQGQITAAQQFAETAAALAPASLTLDQFRHRLMPLPVRLSDPNALWRRWFDGPAQMTEGKQVAKSDLAVVVIGFKCPSVLRDAVRSVLDQDTKAEIVVVNTGGGNARHLLRAELPHIRLIEVDAPLFVGRARNIGIDASDAPIVGFLASDCQALPGWVSHRLTRHAAGADAVPSAVVPVNPRSLSSLAASCWLHRRRWPRPVDEPRSRHGFSYRRTLFDRWGYFPIGPAVAEDTLFNERIYDTESHVWAPEVLTAHRYPTNPVALAMDMFRRGQRRLVGEMGTTLPQFPDPVAELRARVLRRHHLARSVVAELPGLGPIRQLIVRQLIRLSRYSDLAGMRWSLPKLQAAHVAIHLAATGGAPSDREQINAAAAAFPMLSAVHRAKATALRTLNPADGRDQIEPALVAAAALSPGQYVPVQTLCDYLESLGDLAASMQAAEWAAILAPGQHLFLRRARTPASRSERHSEALFFAQMALLVAPWLPEHHRNLALVYEKAARIDTAARCRALADQLDEANRFRSR